MMQAVVISVGPGYTNKNGVLIPPSLKEGDTIILPDFGGQEIKEKDDTYVLIEESQAVAKVDTE